MCSLLKLKFVLNFGRQFQAHFWVHGNETGYLIHNRS